MSVIKCVLGYLRRKDVILRDLNSYSLLFKIWLESLDKQPLL